MSASLSSAFADARQWQVEPTPEAVPDMPADTVTVALELLRRIAEDPILRPSYRIAARRHLRRLKGEAGDA